MQQDTLRARSCSSSGSVVGTQLSNRSYPSHSSIIYTKLQTWRLSSSTVCPLVGRFLKYVLHSSELPPPHTINHIWRWLMRALGLANDPDLTLPLTGRASTGNRFWIFAPWRIVWLNSDCNSESSKNLRILSWMNGFFRIALIDGRSLKRKSVRIIVSPHWLIFQWTNPYCFIANSAVELSLFLESMAETPKSWGFKLE